MRNLGLKVMAFILLGKKKRFFKVVKMKNRNVVINLEEYIPAKEFLEKSKQFLK